MALILLRELMINPNEFNFVTVHCYVPSGVFSGALVQFFTYLQNLNILEMLMVRCNGALNAVVNSPLIGPLERLTRTLSIKHFSTWTRLPLVARLHQTPLPSELRQNSRSNDKKDSHSW
jgi:hypothetical protein